MGVFYINNNHGDSKNKKAYNKNPADSLFYMAIPFSNVEPLE